MQGNNARSSGRSPDRRTASRGEAAEHRLPGYGERTPWSEDERFQSDAVRGEPGERRGPDRDDRGLRAGPDEAASAGLRSERVGQAAPRGAEAPVATARSDERIRDDVLESLESAPIETSDVHVAVAAGLVTLTGTVPNEHTRRLAEDLAEDRIGVTAVENELRVVRR